MSTKTTLTTAVLDGLSQIDYERLERERTDIRPLIGWDEFVPYGGTRPKCTFITHCGYRGPDLTLVKIHHRLHPLGQLIVRCPDHQQRWEARNPDPGERALLLPLGGGEATPEAPRLGMTNEPTKGAEPR